MTKKSFTEKEALVFDWYQIHMDYWHKYCGDLHNRKDHWEDAFHSPNTQEWWDLFDVADVMKRKYPDEWRYQSRLSGDLDELQRRLMNDKPVIKRGVQSYNTPIFRFWMAFKDFLNDVAGTPTKQYTDRDKREAYELENPTPFEQLFER